MSLGFFGYQKMLDGFVTHRDSKLGVEKTISKVQISQSPYHNLFISLFRFPNRFGVGYQDITGIQHVYSVYPEIKEAFGDDYFELVHSSQYNRAIKSEYFSFILSSPGYFIEYVAGGLTDYLLFLPYASWSGSKSAPAYLPKINNDAQLDAQDMPPDFRSSGFQWILNLRFSHLPSDIYFWTYFVIAYSLLLGAIYSAFFARVKSKEISSIYLIRALLIYFAFASIVRILIPNYGHSAAISFNLIIVVYFIHLTMSFREKIRAKTSRLYVLTTSLLLSGVLTVLALTLVDNNVKAKEVEVDMADMYLNGDNSENSSMTIRSTKDGPGSASIFVPVTPGGTYEISASLNGDTADYQMISVETFDKISLASSGHISANARDPKFFRSRFKIGDYDDIIVLKLICGASTSGQAVNFSSISLLKIEDTGASKEVKLPLDMDSSLRSIN
jgi:hypothetical protein